MKYHVLVWYLLSVVKALDTKQSPLFVLPQNACRVAEIAIRPVLSLSVAHLQSDGQVLVVVFHSARGLTQGVVRSAEVAVRLALCVI